MKPQAERPTCEQSWRPAGAGDEARRPGCRERAALCALCRDTSRPGFSASSSAVRSRGWEARRGLCRASGPGELWCVGHPQAQREELWP